MTGSLVCVFRSVLTDIQRVLGPFKFSRWSPFADTLEVVCFWRMHRRHNLSLDMKEPLLWFAMAENSLQKALIILNMVGPKPKWHYIMESVFLMPSQSPCDYELQRDLP